MTCKFCGNEISDSAKFCNGCGAAVEAQTDSIDGVISEETAIPAMTAEVLTEEPSVTEALGETFAEDTRPLRKKPHFLISFLCFWLVIVVFVLEFTLGMLITLKFTTSKETVEKAVESFDITSMEITVDGENKTFAEVILDEVSDENVKQEDIDRVIKEFQGNEYFSSVIVDITDYALNGGDAPKLDADELAGVIEDNKDIIEDVTGEKISDKEIDDFKKSAETFVEDVNQSIEDMDESLGDVNRFTAVFGIDLAVMAVSGVLVFILLILVLAYGLNKSGVYRAFRAYTTPSFITGAFFTAIGVVAPMFVKNFIPEDAGELVSRLIDTFAKFPLYAGITLLVVWFVCLVISIVLKVVYNKRTRV